MHKLALLLVLAMSLIQLSFAVLMSTHANSMENCTMGQECIFEAYTNRTEGVIFTYLLLSVPVFFFVPLARPYQSSSFAPFFHSLPLLKRQLFKGIVQRE